MAKHKIISSMNKGAQMNDEKVKRCEELEELRKTLNEFYKKHVYNTNPETNPAHKIAFESLQQIDAELKKLGYF